MAKADGYRGRNEGWAIDSLWIMLYYYVKRNERKLCFGHWTGARGFRYQNMKAAFRQL